MGHGARPNPTCCLLWWLLAATLRISYSRAKSRDRKYDSTTSRERHYDKSRAIMRQVEVENTTTRDDNTTKKLSCWRVTTVVMSSSSCRIIVLSCCRIIVLSGCLLTMFSCNFINLGSVSPGLHQEINKTNGPLVDNI